MDFWWEQTMTDLLIPQNQLPVCTLIKYKLEFKPKTVAKLSVC